jgi:hypothetical protein
MFQCDFRIPKELLSGLIWRLDADRKAYLAVHDIERFVSSQGRSLAGIHAGAIFAFADTRSRGRIGENELLAACDMRIPRPDHKAALAFDWLRICRVGLSDLFEQDSKLEVLYNAAVHEWNTYLNVAGGKMCTLQRRDTRHLAEQLHLAKAVTERSATVLPKRESELCSPVVANRLGQQIVGEPFDGPRPPFSLAPGNSDISIVEVPPPAPAVRKGEAAEKQMFEVNKIGRRNQGAITFESRQKFQSFLPQVPSPKSRPPLHEPVPFKSVARTSTQLAVDQAVTPKVQFVTKFSVPDIVTQKIEASLHESLAKEPYSNPGSGMFRENEKFEEPFTTVFHLPSKLDLTMWATQNSVHQGPHEPAPAQGSLTGLQQPSMTLTFPPATKWVSFSDGKQLTDAPTEPFKDRELDKYWEKKEFEMGLRVPEPTFDVTSRPLRASDKMLALGLPLPLVHTSPGSPYHLADHE